MQSEGRIEWTLCWNACVWKNGKEGRLWLEWEKLWILIPFGMSFYCFGTYRYARLWWPLSCYMPPLGPLAGCSSKVTAFIRGLQPIRKFLMVEFLYRVGLEDFSLPLVSNDTFGPVNVIITFKPHSVCVKWVTRSFTAPSNFSHGQFFHFIWADWIPCRLGGYYTYLLVLSAGFHGRWIMSFFPFGITLLGE